MGDVATRRNEPACPHRGSLSCRASGLDIDTIVSLILISALQHCLGLWRKRFDLLLEGGGIALGEAQASFKDDRLMAAKRIVEIQRVFTKFT